MLDKALNQIRSTIRSCSYKLNDYQQYYKNIEKKDLKTEEKYKKIFSKILLDIISPSKCKEAIELLVMAGADLEITQRGTGYFLPGFGSGEGSADDYETPLFRAVRIGDLKKIRQLLSLGANVNATGQYGQTPLHDALGGYCQHLKCNISDRIKIISLLLDYDASLTQKDSENYYDVFDFIYKNFIYNYSNDPYSKSYQKVITDTLKNVKEDKDVKKISRNFDALDKKLLQKTIIKTVEDALSDSYMNLVIDYYKWTKSKLCC